MSAPPEAPRRFLVTWRDGQTPRRIHPVGVLLYDENGYRFQYLPSAAAVPGFRPFPSFPELDSSYSSPMLFPFFAARVMDRQRPEYEAFVRALDLPVDADALDVLTRHEALGKGDRMAVTEEPHVEADGSTSHVFVVKGVRYALPDRAQRDQTLTELAPGTPLVVVRDEKNPVNAGALVLVSPAGRNVGWVPDALVPYVSTVLSQPAAAVVVHRRNGPDQPPHIRLLARVEGQLPPGFSPLPYLPAPVQAAAAS